MKRIPGAGLYPGCQDERVALEEELSMKKASKKLSVAMQTVRDLTSHEAVRVDGGTYYYEQNYAMARYNKCSYGNSGCTDSAR